MSKFVRVQTQLRDLNLIKRALDDLKLDYAENQRYVHTFSRFSGIVPLVIRQQNMAFGLRATEDGAYEIIGDDMHLRAIRPQFDRLQQRYAYHTVLAATNEAGFDLVEENVGRDNVIRLTVRRWA